MMLGVVGLGITAVILLARAKPRSPGEMPILQPGQPPLGPPAPPPALPPGLNVPAGAILARNTPPGSQIMNSGTPYRGRIDVAPGDPRETLGRADVRAQLEALGFRDVVVYETADEAGDDIPFPDAKASPGRGTRWFRGVWTSTRSVERRVMPPWITLLWFTSGQPAVVAGRPAVALRRAW